MPVKTFQRSFAGGEISSQMWGRIDDARYQSGLAVCKNFIPLPQGPVENRPGTEFIREVKDSSKPVRLIPFTFSDSDTMVLELGDRYCRFHTKGATLVKNGAPYEIATPWAAEDVFGLQCTQSNDIMTLCHVNYAPQEIRRYGTLDWRVTAIGFWAPLSAPGGVYAVRATSAADDQNADKYTQKYRVTALNADKTRESAASGTASCVANLFAYGTTVRVSWNAVAGASFYRVYKCQGGVYGYIGETDELSIIDDNIDPETGTTPPRYGDVFSNGDWPGCSTYHEQRRCFAGTASHPQRMWMTKSSTESDMSYHLPSVDEDRILFEVASTESSRILHMCSLSGGMVLLTGSGEWRVTSVNNDAITPSSVSVKAQSYVGAGKAQPMVVNNILLYPAARGGHVRELAFNYNAQGYITGDLCLRSAHLFDHYEIRQIAFTKAPQPIVWFVSTSGKLLTLTYVPEQQVGAWAQQVTDGVFESVAAVGEELEDAVYVVVRRVVNGKVRRYVERFHERSFTDPARAFFVDCGATYEGDPVTTISGLSWLEGKTVSILADGAVAPQRVVKDGRIELDHAASIVTVGLPYVSEAQTLPMIIQTQDGAFGQALEKNVCAASVRVYESSGVWAGPSEEALREYKQRTTELPGSPPALATGEIELAVTPAWGKSGQVVFEQTDPLPLTLLSLTLKAAA